MANILVKNIFFPMITRYDGFSHLNKYVYEFEKSQYFSIDKIRELQFIKLKKIINHAYKNVEFYKNRLDQCELKPESIKDFDDIKKIPPLTKKDIQENGSSLIAKNIAKNNLHRSSSGGTTGTMLWFFRDNQSLIPKEASLIRFEKWTGWEIGEWMSLIWPAVIDVHENNSWKHKLKNFLAYRRKTLAFTVINDSDIKPHLQYIKEANVSMIRAFPIALIEVAKYVLNNKFDGFSLKGIITTGETLYKQQREIIEKAFQCPVFNSYRTREIGPIAQECEKHKGLHINSELVYLEIDNNKITDENDVKSGKILLTDFNNYGMPFIRYEIGDVGEIANESCSCGRGLPLLKEIGGRLVDVLYASDGKKVASITVMPNLVEHLGITNQIQFEQHSLNQLTIRMSKPQPGMEVINKQKEVAKKIFGEEMNIVHDFVESIPLLQSGKYRLVISHVKKNNQKTKVKNEK